VKWKERRRNSPLYSNINNHGRAHSTVVNTSIQSRQLEPSLNGDARQHAALLRPRFALCKPDPAEKKPTYQRWGTYSLEASDFQADDMIGILGGPLSDGGVNQHATATIDLDAIKAVALADEFLPATGMEEGRKSKPRSHRYFLIPFATIPEWARSHAEQAAQAAIDETGHPGPFKKSFQTESGETLIDFIGTGGQAVCHGVHSSGERREWTGGAPGQPLIVDFEDLWLAVCRLAESCGSVPPSGLKWPWDDRSDPPRHVYTVRAGSRANVETRAISYLAKIPGAVSKHGGHRQTFYAARVIVYGFDLGAELGFRILKENYNPRCQPEWSDRELWHKVQDADRLPYNKPRGWLLNESNSPPEVDLSAFDAKSNTPKQAEPTTGKTTNAAPPPGSGEQSGGKKDEGKKDDYRFKFNPITSRELADGDFRIDWLVDYLLAAGQPGVIGAFAKSMKTTIAIALALALGTGTAFLGKFNVRRKVRVAVLSGESGKWVIQETARRIAKSMGINLADADVLWGFDLPQLANLMDLAELERGLKAAGVDVVIIDPLYLCLLSGDIGADASKNVYEMGPHLLAISRRCLEIGVTPVFIHHSNRSIKVGEPMELQHLSGAGVAEFVRQWILLNRDTAYVGDGIHKIWMTVGGSAGQGGLYLLRIDEGTAQSEGGRHWDVEVLSATEAKKERKETKKEKSDSEKAMNFKANVERCYELICLLCETKPHWVIKRKIRSEEPAWSDTTVDLLIEKLLTDDRIEHKTIKPPKGKGGYKKPMDGYRPKPKKSDDLL
jgi:AAA domain